MIRDGMVLKSDKKVNWGIVKRLFSSQTFKDFDKFLDALPRRAGLSPIIAAGVMWVAAGVSILFAYTKSMEMSEIQKQFLEAEALTPSVPKIEAIKISDAELEPFVLKLAKVYPNLRINFRRGGKVSVQANSTKLYTQWRAAIDHFSYGRSGWRVAVEEMCVGRECEGMPLFATIRIEQVSISVPQTK